MKSCSSFDILVIDYLRICILKRKEFLDNNFYELLGRLLSVPAQHVGKIGEGS